MTEPTLIETEEFKPSERRVAQEECYRIFRKNLVAALKLVGRPIPHNIQDVARYMVTDDQYLGNPIKQQQPDKAALLCELFGTPVKSSVRYFPKQKRRAQNG